MDNLLLIIFFLDVELKLSVTINQHTSFDVNDWFGQCQSNSAHLKKKFGAPIFLKAVSSVFLSGQQSRSSVN